MLSEPITGRGPNDDGEERVARWAAQKINYPLQTIIGLPDVVNAASTVIDLDAP